VKSSISRQLIFWLAIPLMLVALCGALVHYLDNVAPAMHSGDLRLRNATAALSERIRFANGRWSLAAAPDAAAPLALVADITYALHDPQGVLLLGDHELPSAPLARNVTQSFALSQVGNRRLRTLSTRLSEAAGPVVLTVADTRAPAAPAARLGLMNTLLWDFVQLDITLVLVWVGIQLGLRPLKRLRDAIAARSPLDLRSIDEASIPREITPVVVTLNRLFSLLRASVQSQQQFISNTAHQLRTPITGMQAQLDLLIAEEGAQPIKGRLLTLQEGIRQLAHTANQLLTLARADPAANIAIKKQTVELAALIGDVAAKFFDRALKGNIDLGVDLTPIRVLADPSLLDDLVSNLVDNALKYTPAGGSVTLTTGRMDGKPYLAVEDTGPGIPPEERQRVRQRFYRLPNSAGHGSGLGLAIVDEIARIHDATVAIANGEGGRGTRVSVQF
jgi:two-component system sensor histidine kinase TctE